MQINNLEKEVKILKENKDDLEIGNEKLKTSLSKFVRGRDNLNALLNNVKPSFRKEGIGYQPKHKTIYSKTTPSSTPFATCFYCNKKGHYAKSCQIRKFPGKAVWVRKDLIKEWTNNQGPSRMWVPKHLE